VHNVVLGGFHATLGIALLALGATALLGRKSRRARHPRIGEAYFWVLTVALGTGLADGVVRQVAEGGGLSLFELVTPPTWALGLLGYLMAKRRPGGWLRWHIIGQGGSYIGVLTAFGFQVLPRVLPETFALTMAYWLVPTLVGTILIRRTVARWVQRPALAGRRVGV
jgi:hypothetical protein